MNERMLRKKYETAGKELIAAVVCGVLALVFQCIYFSKWGIDYKDPVQFLQDNAEKLSLYQRSFFDPTGCVGFISLLVVIAIMAVICFTRKQDANPRKRLCMVGGIGFAVSGTLEFVLRMVLVVVARDITETVNNNEELSKIVFPTLAEYILGYLFVLLLSGALLVTGIKNRYSAVAVACGGVHIYRCFYGGLWLFAAPLEGGYGQYGVNAIVHGIGYYGALSLLTVAMLSVVISPEKEKEALSL